MEQQSYAKHAKYVPMYHVLTFGLISLTLVGSLVNLYHSIGDHSRILRGEGFVKAQLPVT